MPNLYVETVQGVESNIREAHEVAASQLDILLHNNGVKDLSKVQVTTTITWMPAFEKHFVCHTVIIQRD